MSRNEGRIGSDDAQAVDAAEILEQVKLEVARRSRPPAVVRYLAAGEGWKEASAELGGAFAPPAQAADG